MNDVGGNNRIEETWNDKAKGLYRRLTEQQKIGGAALVDDVLDLMDLLLAHVSAAPALPMLHIVAFRKKGALAWNFGGFNPYRTMEDAESAISWYLKLNTENECRVFVYEAHCNPERG